VALPAFESAGAYSAITSAGASLAVPSGTAAGKVAVVVMYLDGAALTVTPPTGFAPAPGSPVVLSGSSGLHSLHIWWKRLTAADAGTYDFTWTGSRYREAQVLLYSGVVAAGDAFESPAGTAFEAVSSTTTPPVSVTTTGPDRRLLWAGTNWSGGTWTAPASPAGFVKRVQGGAGLVTLADASWASAGATGDVVGTSTNSDKRTAWMAALIGTTPTPGDVVTGAAALSASGSLTAAGRRATVAQTALTASGSLTATGTRVVHSGPVALAASAGLDAAGTRVAQSGPITLTMTSDLAVSTGGAAPSGPILMTAAATLTASARRVVHSGPVALAASAGLTAAGDRVVHATAGLAQTATATVHAVVQVRAGVVLAADTVLTITGDVLQAPIRLGADAALTARGTVLVQGRAALSGSGVLVVEVASGPQDLIGHVQGFVIPEGAARSSVGSGS
jgi:hypothetical protein